MEPSRQTRRLQSTSEILSGTVIGKVMRNDGLLLLVESGLATIFHQRLGHIQKKSQWPTRKQLPRKQEATPRQIFATVHGGFYRRLLPLGERDATLRGENELEALPLGTRPNEGKPTSKHNALPYVSRGPKYETCRMTKTTRASCQN